MLHFVCADRILCFVQSQFVCSLWPTGDNSFSPRFWHVFVSFNLKENQVEMTKFTFFIQNLDNLVLIQF